MQRNNLLPSGNSRRHELELSRRLIGIQSDLKALLSSPDGEESIMADRFHEQAPNNQPVRITASDSQGRASNSQDLAPAKKGYRQHIGSHDVLAARLLYTRQSE